MPRNADDMGRSLVSIVVPAFNEDVVLQEFYDRTTQTLADADFDIELVFVDDGSTDGTLAKMNDLAANDPRITVVGLSRNFGKEAALTAGIDHAHGDAVVPIDADLQDPPELIPELVKRWREGYDVVYARRTHREGESWVKRTSANLFYRVMQRSGDRVSVPANTGDFRILSRRATDALKQMRERHRYMKGLFAWIGFPQTELPYKREPRAAGKTKWNYWRLWNLSIEGITSFTIAPLKMATYLGLITAFGSMIYAVILLYETLVHGNSVAGYPSLMTVILFLGGVQLTTLGIIGEYLGRIFDETKDRPLYFVSTYQASRVPPKDERAPIKEDRSPTF